MIRCPDTTIRQVERLLVRCDCCDYRAELLDRTEALDAALVSAGYVHELRAEWAHLQRLQALVATVPDWRERFVSSGFIRRAPEFQDALQADPALDDFLRHGSFRLVPRFQFIDSALREHEAGLPRHLLHCPSCAEGFIYIEPEVFDRL